MTDDPGRSYSGFPGQLITVHDPDDPAIVLRFIPETGNTGTGGGAYLLLDRCPGCSLNQRPCEVPMVTIAGLADLGLYQQQNQLAVPSESSADNTSSNAEVPIEFFDDPGHAVDCPLR